MNQNLYLAFYTQAQQQPDKPALALKHRNISYGQCIIHIDSAIAVLRTIPVKPGARIAVVSDNAPELFYLCMVASCLQLQLIFLYDLNHATPTEVQQLLVLSQPDYYLFPTANHMQRYAHLIPCERVFFFTIFHAHPHSQRRVDTHPTLPSMPLLQAYTSGTTGTPKGVALSEHALLTQVTQIAQMMQLDHLARVLLPGYLFNTVGLPLCCATLLRGGTAIFNTQNTAQRLFFTVAKQRITHVMLQPIHLAHALEDADLLQYHLNDLRLIAYGAATMHSALIQRARTLLPCQWLQGYGLTETCGPITWLNEAEHRSKPGSVGRAAEHTQLTIVDDTGNPLPALHTGNIALRGDTLMLGYVDHYTQQPLLRTTSQGSWLSGDCGYLDVDGYLYLQGRKKDCIVTANGFTLYPREVECVLENNVDVLDIAIIGVTLDPLQGEIALAVIQITQTHALPRLKAQLCRRISALKWPHYVVLLHDPLPRTQAGKINKNALRTQVPQWLSDNKLLAWNNIPLVLQDAKFDG